MTTLVPSRGGEGAEVIYALRNNATYPTMILNEIKLAGQVIRRVYQRPLPENPNQDYYYIMRDTTNIQPVIVEYGFLDNINDATRLKYNWMRYAEAVIKATCDYIGYPYRPPYSDEIIYTVQSGDTLWNIANRFQISVDAIMRLNNLTSTNINVGQRLRIPLFNQNLPEETFTYTVVRGDSLWSIANRFNTTIDEIKRLNNLTSDLLSIGQQLLIPGRQETPEIPPPPINRPTLRLGDRGEDVRDLQNLLTSLGYNPGTIDGIFGQNTLNAVKTFQTNNGLYANGIVEATTWNALLSGGVLPEETFTYTVVRGDSLWSIANRFNTTIDEIRKLNNLTSDLLSIGQQLLIPRREEMPTHITYTVVRGDSLWSIANRFNTTIDEIRKLNNLTSDLLSIGQQLLIPM